ncbi:hypothetical protein A3K93_11870 [Acinetobacter sp. NCu2D-2]|uniref:RcnB family protein n=1 Tax=Acinetobacter sp. NCu2D-2 TaxID=1608473 RepID=UPI0007CDDE4A|nr:RcnB family protein [Acinetobacter sp. NCu2D-2]ANF82812.1 hypothetical protein A3K93_11870 [Acinetobacter sp. NCu2D-2]
MNTLFKAIVLSVSTALVAAPAMAAPQDHQRHAPQVQNKHHQAPVHQQQKAKPFAKKAVNPSRDWRVGQKVPSQYYGQGFKIDHKHYKKLSKPGKNQQWLKVNGDYILTNVINHKILKIIAG